MNWTDLFSGFIGAIAGGVLSILGGWYATKWAWKRDEERRAREREEERRACIEGMLVELEDKLGAKGDLADAHCILGAALVEKGDLEGAERQFREAVRLEPNNASAHRGLAFALREKGDLDGAEKEEREAARLEAEE